jgi:hypothetical protein
LIRGNVAEDSGGGIGVAFSGGVTIRECVLTGNQTEDGGGGGIAFADDGGGNVVRSCTIAGNAAGYGGGGVATSHGALIDRSVLWGNCAPHGDELYAMWDQSVFVCSSTDSSGVYAWNASILFDGNCVFTDPMFCGPVPCGIGTGGDWTLAGSSPCLPNSSPCGLLIGALEQGCGVPPGPTGACCYQSGLCVVEASESCAEENGTYMGDDTVCVPNPCVPTPVERTSWGRIKARFR